MTFLLNLFQHVTHHENTHTNIYRKRSLSLAKKERKKTVNACQFRQILSFDFPNRIVATNLITKLLFYLSIVCIRQNIYNNTAHCTVGSIVSVPLSKMDLSNKRCLLYSAYVPKRKCYSLMWMNNTKFERMLMLLDDAQHNVDADGDCGAMPEKTTTTTTKNKKNQLLQSNWFWTLSFTYSTYFWKTHIAHAAVVAEV